MISQQLDLSSFFVTGGASSAVIDVSGWQRVSVQFVNPSGAINFKCTDDSGAVQGITDGDASTATNFNAVQLTNLALGTAATSASAAGTFKGDIYFKFLQLAGTSVTADKVLVFLSKPV